MKRLFALLLTTCILTGCGVQPSESQPTEAVTEPEPTQTTSPTEAETEAPKDPIELLLEGMSVEEKVGQLFLARCPDKKAIEDIQAYHLGGYILFAGIFKMRPRNL